MKHQIINAWLSAKRLTLCWTISSRSWGYYRNLDDLFLRADAAEIQAFNRAVTKAIRDVTRNDLKTRALLIYRWLVRLDQAYGLDVAENAALAILAQARKSDTFVMLNFNDL